MAVRKTSAEKKAAPRRGNRALFDEPTQFVAVRLPASTVEEIDAIVTEGHGLYRDRSDFIRETIMRALSQGHDVILQKQAKLKVRGLVSDEIARSTKSGGDVERRRKKLMAEMLEGDMDAAIEELSEILPPLKHSDIFDSSSKPALVDLSGDEEFGLEIKTAVDKLRRPLRKRVQAKGAVRKKKAPRSSKSG